jgi:hypothetical protein
MTRHARYSRMFQVADGLSLHEVTVLCDAMTGRNFDPADEQTALKLLERLTELREMAEMTVAGIEDYRAGLPERYEDDEQEDP